MLTRLRTTNTTTMTRLNCTSTVQFAEHAGPLFISLCELVTLFLYNLKQSSQILLFMFNIWSGTLSVSLTALVVLDDCYRLTRTVHSIVSISNAGSEYVYHSLWTAENNGWTQLNKGSSTWLQTIMICYTLLTLALHILSNPSSQVYPHR